MANLQDIFHNMSFDADDTRGMHYNSRVLLVDAMNLFIRCWTAVPAMDDNGRHIGAISGFLKSLGLAIRTFKPTRCIVVFDGKGGSQRRRKVYPQYKANRKPPIRLNRAYDMTTDEEEKENMKWQLVTLVELLEYLPVTVFALDNVEADDVIAYLSQLITNADGSSIIFSSDKDFLQLAAPNVTIYNPIKKKSFTVDTILEDYGIHPQHFYFFRALNGDKSDNIDGVRGVGETTLKKFLPEVADPSVTLTVDFIEQKFAGQKKVPKMIQNILANRDIVERNMYLMNLHDGVMSVDARMKVANIFEHHNIDFRKYDLTKALMHHKILGSIPNYDAWVAQSFLPLNRFKDTV
jgi:DNA polymerase I